MFWRFISPTVFLISLAVGLLFVYLSAPSPDVELVYPTPANAGHVQYVDKAHVCHEFVAQKVKCPKTGAKSIPAQK